MPNIIHITPTFAVSGSLKPGDLAEAARMGFKSVINNRPDGEQWGQLEHETAAAEAEAAGLAYRFVPVTMHDIFGSGALEANAEAIDAMKGPVLAFCRSGTRSTILWAAVEVSRGADVDDVLKAAAAAGYDLEAVRDHLGEIAAGVNAR